MFKTLLSLSLLVSTLLLCGSVEAQTYPLNQQTTPITVINNTVNYNFGWRFRVNSASIIVTKLGSFFPAGSTPATKTVTLFTVGSPGTVLGQVVCPAGSGWQFTDLSTPVALTNGVEYIVAAHTTADYHHNDTTAWKPTGDIEYISTAYTSTTSPNTYPPSVSTLNVYGMADIGYIKGFTVTTDANLPNAGEGVSYSQTIQADFGTPAYTWQMTAGSLPNGVTLTASGDDFLLAGTPTYGSAGTYNFDVEVTDSTSATSTKSMTLIVGQLIITNANPLADGQETVAYNETFTAVNGSTPYVWSVTSGALPSGLTLTQVGQTYELSGTPLVGAIGNYTFELQVIDSNSTVATKTFDLYIDWASGALTYPLTEQDPAATGFTASTAASARSYGYRFTCNSGGIAVYRLGSNMPAASAGVAKTCTLWDMSGTILGQVTTGPGTGWQWTNLTSPVLLTNGTDYIVTVHTTNGFYFDTTVQASWIPTGDIQYVGARYVASSSANTFPTTQWTGNRQYGVADIGYAKGLTVLSGPQLPTAAEGTAYTTNIQADFGTTPYTWQHVSGTLPNGLTLTPAGDEFELSGTPAGGSAGTYNFTVEVTDNVSDTFIKQLTVYIAPPATAMPFTDDFSTDKGWQLGTDWQRGVAQAYTASGPTRSEPATDNSPSSDNMIAGHLIGADYAANMSSTVWLTSPPVDCTNATFVSLRYYRWLGMTLSDTAEVQVNNGSGWTNVWIAPTGTTGFTDSAWTFSAHDITAEAAGYAVVQVRFGIGPTNTVVNVGWCIDDIEILDAGPELEVREGGLTGTLISDDQAVGGLRDFGQVGVSVNSTTLYIGLTNTTGSDISITQSKSGANPGDFYIVVNAPVTLLANTSAVMELVFYSTTPGVLTATIELAHNALYSGSTPFQINLRAEAVVLTPVIQVTQTTSGGTNIPHQNSATGTPRDFGSIAVSNSSAPIDIVITNTGTGDLTISSIDMGGTWWNQFAANGGTMPVALASSASMTFTVAFQPTGAGVKGAYVRIVHNGTVSPTPYEVPVTGVGVAGGVPLIDVSDGTTLAHNDIAGGNRDFGNISLASSSAPLTITITNNGSVVLNIATPILGGTGAGEYALSNLPAFPAAISVGNSITFDITFTPTTTGGHGATVEFIHDDTSVNIPFTINVTGTGVVAGSGSGGGDDDDDDEGGCVVGTGALALPLLFPLLIAYRRRRCELLFVAKGKQASA